MKNLFSKYCSLREEKGPDGSVTSRIKLQKKDGSKEFLPFTVNRSTHSNLRFLIKAFSDSKNVGVGYTTIDKSKGEIEPQLKKKSLYLTGGAVRDHLKGKTPRNYDLVTDATMSEIRMILTHPEARFTETKPRQAEHAKESKYTNLPAPGTKNKIFYVSRWDKQGKEIELTVEINHEDFSLAPFSKSLKSRIVQPESTESAASVEEDASNRDFTINSLYIPLTTADGENNDLIDPHGGAHHLKTGEVKAVNDDFESRVSEDPSTSLRYMKIVNRFGDSSKIPEEYAKSITKHKDLIGISKDHIRKEFISGLENKDCDPKKYIKGFSSTGLLGSIFPGVEFDPEDMPEDFKGDRWLATAWILRNNDPAEIKDLLISNSWSSQEAGDISYLVKLYNWGSKNKFDPKDFYDVKNSHIGLTKSKIKDWMQMSKANGPELDSFLNQDDSDLTSYTSGPEGRKVANPQFVKYLGRSPQGTEFDAIRRILSTSKFKDALGKLD